MTTQHFVNGLTFGISITIISWIVGMMLNSLLIKTKYYNKLSELNFITSKTLNKRIGLQYFKWIVKNTFFKFFNQKLKLTNKGTDLIVIRNEMTFAEINHLIGFVFVLVFALYKSVSVNFTFGLLTMIPNVFLNLYPSLLQQENKRRIDRLINKTDIQ